MLKWMLLLITWTLLTCLLAQENDQCSPVKCDGVILVGKYPYKVETIKFDREGRSMKVDVQLVNELIDTFYNDKPIPLLETYKFIAELLNENPKFFKFMLALDLKKYNLNSMIADVIWDFFADPTKNLNKKDDKANEDGDKAQQLLANFIAKLLNAFTADERTIYNLRDFMQEQLDNDDKLITHLRNFLNEFLEQFKDTKDKLRKLILKMVVALEVMKVENVKGDEVKNQQDQLVKLIKDFFAASPRLKTKIVDLIIDVQTMHNLLPSKLYLRLGIK